MSQVHSEQNVCWKKLRILQSPGEYEPTAMHGITLIGFVATC